MTKSQQTLEERFWSRVDKKGLDDCWNWKGWRDKDGYGQIKIGRKGILAHRAAYQFFTGKIPDGLLICHKCDNPSCVNPNHLFLGTQKDNIQDAVKKGRMAANDKHYSRLYPEKLARGNRSGRRLHPESYLGERNSRSKLAEEQVKEIRALYAMGDISIRKLATIYDMSKSSIWSVLVHKGWKHLP
jgi:hypothetical protein